MIRKKRCKICGVIFAINGDRATKQAIIRHYNEKHKEESHYIASLRKQANEELSLIRDKYREFFYISLSGQFDDRQDHFVERVIE